MKQPTKLEQQLCFEVYKASSNFSKMYANALEPFKLTFPQYLVLLVLWEENDVLTKNISERLGLGIGTVNPIIKRMIDNGHLIKKQSQTDKRAFVISLTEQAKDEQPAIEKAVFEIVTSCNFMGVNATTLMKNLKELNATFNTMDF
ncbi:MarR family winged helix-turn-helix transcriptional regulator [Planococcus versutus]|uniref:HTH-type transcriptional regulator MgrA n=1 Tax=Planococcus versutus TaxID=1302659 RepID=A0A1B1S1E4_9BACL|nr:MarR family transcriptional regulator [Planococcus versutus]ANU27010.1 MarR family transcriptional regulator [Planococcus versutus]